MARGTYFQGNDEHPYHVSIGAVVLNKKGEVLCHYFGEPKASGYMKDNGLSDMYILMRETPNPGESIEIALARGLVEEFGVEGEMVTYIGSLRTHFPSNGVKVEKTTLYFLVKAESFNLSKRSNEDEEYESVVDWKPIKFLMEKMKQQTKRFGRTDMDESEILERVKILK